LKKSVKFLNKMIDLGIKYKQCSGIQKDQKDEQKIQKIQKNLKNLIYIYNDLMKIDYIKPM
jgi:hypothetical protein